MLLVGGGHGIYSSDDLDLKKSLKKKTGSVGGRVVRIRNMDEFSTFGFNPTSPQDILERLEDAGEFSVNKRQENIIDAKKNISSIVDVKTSVEGEEEIKPEEIFVEEVFFFPQSKQSKIKRSCVKKDRRNFKKLEKNRIISERKKMIQNKRRPARREALLEETGVLLS